MSEENIHITLKFLGDVDEKNLDRINARLESCAKSFAPFSDELCGLGIFPSPRSPRVVWAGTKDGKKFCELNRCVDDALSGIGIPKERRFYPHATIYRVKNDRANEKLLEIFKKKVAFDGGRFEIKSIDLMSSELTPNGPIYKKIASHSLRDPNE